MQNSVRQTRWVPNTLSARLFLYTTLIALIGLGLIAFTVTADYRNNAEQRFHEVLSANLYNLLGTVSLDDRGQLTGDPNLGDARFGLFDSGWYWSIRSVSDPDNRLSSPSLATQIISAPDEVVFDETFQRTFDWQDQAGNDLLVLEAQAFLGEGDDLFNFMVAANRDELDTEVAGFATRLIFILSIFAFTMIAASYLLVRLGLRPLALASRKLADVRSGAAERIDGNFPDDISPLIEETNALIASNNSIVERSRTQVGNLAHSLKTPLAVLRNEFSSGKKGAPGHLVEQLDDMQQQIQVYLDRARISARKSTLLSRTEIVPVLEKLASVITKLNSGIEVELKWNVDGRPIFAGEEHDLQEVFGNLLENAAKYADARVQLTVEEGAMPGGGLVFLVEDDGAGMPEAEINKASKRGGRVDEGKPGWGLGLSIVHDIVAEYDGRLTLGKSALGGLRAEVALPGTIEQTSD